MQKILIQNKRANYEFELLERFEAGLVLKGHEAKSLKSGGGNFIGAYVGFEGEELFIRGFNVAPYQKATLEHHDPTRERKLLLHAKEIQKIASALHTKGVTLIPLACGLVNGRIKLEIAIARGKKKHDKREAIKKRETSRSLQAELSNH